jgi:creatinine amidohydrolase/Fe(II)-dependent formamide hydrolase-like protein
MSDLLESIEQSGVRKCVLLNSHGGNDLKPLLRELYGKTTAHIFLCNIEIDLISGCGRLVRACESEAELWVA